LTWGSAQAQQRINEGDPGNTCKIAQVVGRENDGTPPDEPYDDVVVTYDQPLTDIWSKRSVVWTVGAIGKASASIGLGPDGCRNTADDQPNPSDGQVYNTRRDARCPTASNMMLELSARDLPYGLFWAAVGLGDRYDDFPAGEGIDATDFVGFKLELGTTDDPNTVHVTRALIGTDKIITDVYSPDLVGAPGQISNNGQVVGRMDDYPWSTADNVIWRLDIPARITANTPYEFNFNNYNVRYPTQKAALIEPNTEVLTGPNLDAYDPLYNMGNTFNAMHDWTINGGVAQATVSLLPATATQTRGMPGFNSDYRPSIVANPTSRGTGALFGKSVAGAGPTDSIIIYEVDNAGIIAANHYIVTFPTTIVPCDDENVTLDYIEGAHYHGSSAFAGPFGIMAVNAAGHVAAPVYFGELNNDTTGRDQAILWTDGDSQNPVWGVVAYHGQAWDTANCQTGGVPWILGLADPLETYPFSNPTLDDYDNVFFVCPYKESETSNSVGLFRASWIPGEDPPCWEIDLIVSQYDRWTDDNGVEAFLTDLRCVGASGMPANGTVGSNSLVSGLLPGAAAPVLVDAEPVGPLSNSGVVFNGTTLIDESPAQNLLEEVACNDDNAGECAPDVTDSALTFEAESGTTYFIEITSRWFSGPGGMLDFYFECDDGSGTDLGVEQDLDVAASDECTGAVEIKLGDYAFTPSLQDTTVATLAEADPYQSCTIVSGGTGPRRNSHSVWYYYQPDKDCTMTIQTCGSTPDDTTPGDPDDNNDTFYNTVVTVYTGACGPPPNTALSNDGLKGKGRFATANGFNFTVFNPAEIAGVGVRDSLEIISGSGTTDPGYYEVVTINHVAGTMVLSGNAGVSTTNDVVWQVDDSQFFNQLLYLKPYQEAAPPPTCICGDIDESGGPVDLVDFATFALCFGQSGPIPGCDADAFECGDLDGSGGPIDLVDFATFANLFGLVSTKTVPDCQ